MPMKSGPAAHSPEYPSDNSSHTSRSAKTKLQILETAEREFAENGFAGTTLRTLVKKAGVNLAAVSYHFGSKEDLFRAVVARIAHPIVTRELEAADALEARAKVQARAITLEEVLTAFLQPPLQYLSQTRELEVSRAVFMGRCRTEPAPIQKIAATEFDISTNRFLDLLEQAMPGQSRRVLAWKLDFVITLLIRTLTEIGQPNALLQSNSNKDIERAVKELVQFAAAGIRGTVN